MTTGRGSFLYLNFCGEFSTSHREPQWSLWHQISLCRHTANDICPSPQRSLGSPLFQAFLFLFPLWRERRWKFQPCSAFDTPCCHGGNLLIAQVHKWATVSIECSVSLQFRVLFFLLIMLTVNCFFLIQKAHESHYPSIHPSIHQRSAWKIFLWQPITPYSWALWPCDFS